MTLVHCTGIISNLSLYRGKKAIPITILTSRCLVKADATFNQRKLTVPSEAIIPTICLTINLYCVEVPIIMYETSRCYLYI